MGDDLPLLYRQLLPRLFEQPIAVETFATCSNCIMVCSEEDQEQLTRRPYHPDTKCCTYQPDLPNYLVGGLLASTDPLLEDGRTRMRERIRQRAGVSPVGVHAPRLYNVLYQHGTKHGFGRSKTLLCPYYRSADGACTIWKFRDATCSTWFCKTVSGNAGRDFWTAMKIYLKAAQNVLVQYALRKAGLDPAALTTRFNDPPLDAGYLSVEDLDGLPPDENEYASRWAGWNGDEESFFVQCHAWVRELDQAKFETMMGGAQVLLSELVEKRDETRRIPELLKRNDALPYQKRDDDHYIVILADSEATIDLPIVLIDSFDGTKSTAEIRQQLLHDFELEVEDELLATLFQHHVLLELV
jgi:hypothetical protein